MIVTGEASGDLHGAKLINSVTELSPETVFFGVGGHLMAAAGCDILIRSEDLAVMGIVEIAGHFSLIWKSFQRLKGILHSSEKPDALVLIDFPEFNLRLAKQAKKAGVPVLYYVSPQVWAWRRGRVRKIAKIVDSLAAIFPFEPQLYDGLDINVQYVGHPLLDEFDDAVSSVGSGLTGLPEGKKIVGLFPGSRKSELRYMLDTMIETAGLLWHKQQDVHFLVPVAGSLSLEDIKDQFPLDLPVTFVESHTATIYDVARRCDVVLTVSGTVTLQVALVGTPMTVLYKLSPLSFAIGKRLVKVDHISLANIVAGSSVVREFIQSEATPRALVDELKLILNDEVYAGEIRGGLAKVQHNLGEPGCAARVAEMVLELVA
jgi:lipid-A-disaccharide synthase